MARRRFYDARQPTTLHTVRIDGVDLTFGDDGILADPTAEQVQVMEADPYRRQRFLEGQLPRSPRQDKPAEKPAGGTTIPPAGDSTKRAPAPAPNADKPVNDGKTEQ